MRPKILYPLFAPLTSLNGIGDRVASLLTKMINGDAMIDLLWHHPRDLLYRKKIQGEFINQSAIITITLNISDYEKAPTKSSPHRFICYSDAGQRIDLVFFKSSTQYIKQQLPIGEQRIISGRCDFYKNKWQITHPDYIARLDKAHEIPEYEVIYPLSMGITGKNLRKYIAQSLHTAQSLQDMPEWLDDNIIKKYQLPSWVDAVNAIHHPKKISDLDMANPAYMRLAYDELLAYQLALALTRTRQQKRQGNAIAAKPEIWDQFYQQLGFTPTQSQIHALNEISNDMQQPKQMLRLLQGDVGCGKSFVGVAAALQAIGNGYQAAFMAPTEILAHQHYKKCQEWLAPLDYNIVLLTGKMPAKQRKEAYSKIADGTANMVIGTHALFQENVAFHRLGFIIIDEQHRFGVQQRLKLTEKGNRPDILMMTATPIPRTMLLSVYGDIATSLITEKPAGRQEIITSVMHEDKSHLLIEKIKQQIINNTQIYWVCPLIEESEQSDLSAATEKHQQLAKIFGDQQTALLHGKMKPDEKQAIMDRFKDGIVKILVSTTVIEVGIDVPSANIMIIEQAQRFGLSQMHQLRGRVGRGGEQGHCVLLHNGQLSQISKKRLDIMRTSNDGFYIAEQDLKLRGSGEILGTRQSGLPDFNWVDLNIHDDLLNIAYDDARYIMNQDPEFQSPRAEKLKILLYLHRLEQAIENLRAG